jgi:hypothetical protein
MGRLAVSLLLCTATLFARAQEPSAPQIPAPPAPNQQPAPDAPLPAIGPLLQDVERNEKISEAARADYTYRIHLEQQELDGSGNPKKTTVTDSDSLTIDGVRIDRVTARNGKPLTPEEAAKENARIDKDVAKAKERRAKSDSQGRPTDSRGDQLMTASRVLELGTFTNPRRVLLDGRPTLVFDYAGDPHAHTEDRFESIVRDLVGTVWIDERDRVLARGEGHFLNDFKVGGGLLADVKKNSSFSFKFAKVNGEVWLPAVIDGQGHIRILLFAGFNGRLHLETSDYRKFRTTSTIVSTHGIIGPDGEPVPDTPPPTPKP